MAGRRIRTDIVGASGKTGEKSNEQRTVVGGGDESAGEI